MTDDPAILAGTFKSRRLLLLSESVVNDMLDVFQDAATETAKTADKASLAEMKSALLVYSKARNELIDEVKKHEKHVLEARGLIASAPIDFDRLRVEIGRSLDRIRTARDAEGIPGGSF
ncbi:hypothetical protein [Silicimonas algicola]|uniref:Uncharacterized protein n=1 Tax=Silicimonas algicola TaxID=1826607 RepID=A0A316GDT1_9RHOB|nr:hypothetical protein [Silicimonas algicola]PWK57540.1 hypothetical protein C8D95_102184 [Silicimonas algicola]